MDHVLNWLWQGSASRLRRSRRCACSTGPARRFAMSSVGSRCWPSWRCRSCRCSEPDAGLGGDRRYAHAHHAVLAIPVAWWTSGAVIAGLWVLWCLARGPRDRIVGRGPARQTPVAAISGGAGIAPDVLERGARPAGAGRAWSFERRAGGRGPGLGSPVIVLPPDVLRRLGDQEIDRAVIHEWAHVQR